MSVLDRLRELDATLPRSMSTYLELVEGTEGLVELRNALPAVLRLVDAVRTWSCTRDGEAWPGCGNCGGCRWRMTEQRAALDDLTITPEGVPA